MVTSGFNRPITGNIMLFPPERRATCGVQASTPAGNSKPGRHDADDHATHTVQRHVAAQHRHVATVALFPQRIAQHDRLLDTGLAIVSVEGPSMRCRDAQDVEEFRRDAARLDDDRIAGADQAAIERGEGRQVGEGLVAVVQRHVVVIERAGAVTKGFRGDMATR